MVINSFDSRTPFVIEKTGVTASTLSARLPDSLHKKIEGVA